MKQFQIVMSPAPAECCGNHYYNQPELLSTTICSANQHPLHKRHIISWYRGCHSYRTYWEVQCSIYPWLVMIIVNRSGRAVRGMGLCDSLAGNCGFEYHRGHGCLFHVSVVYYLCVGLIIRREESFSGANLLDNVFTVFQHAAISFLATRNTNRT